MLGSKTPLRNSTIRLKVLFVQWLDMHTGPGPWTQLNSAFYWCVPLSCDRRTSTWRVYCFSFIWKNWIDISKHAGMMMVRCFTARITALSISRLAFMLTSLSSHIFWCPCLGFLHLILYGGFGFYSMSEWILFLKQITHLTLNTSTSEIQNMGHISLHPSCPRLTSHVTEICSQWENLWKWTQTSS